jgi:hypothetical protein
LDRLITLASRMGFKGNDIRGVELTYYNHLNAAEETLPLPRTVAEIQLRAEETKAAAYTAATAYVRRMIDEWQK